LKHDPDFMEKFTRDLEARKAAAIILEIDELAGKEKLKKAYRAAAAKYHPDHNGNTPEANKRFILVKCAYELLAFDKPCDILLREINTWPGVPEKDGKYKLDNHGDISYGGERNFLIQTRKMKKQSTVKQVSVFSNIINTKDLSYYERIGCYQR